MPKTAKTYETSESQADFHNADQTLIIFDWDDTFCPSCWIQDQAPELSFLRPPPQEERFLQPLRRLEDTIARLLDTALRLGKVVIVTNAQEPWVETSCRHFLPGLEPYLRRIPVRYAHAQYEDEFGLESNPTPIAEIFAQSEAISAGKGSSGDEKGQGLDSTQATTATGISPAASLVGTARKDGADSVRTTKSDFKGQGTGAVSLTTVESSLDLEAAPRMWKEAAFREELKEFYSRYANQSWKNVVSVGDSIYERDALRHVTSGRPTKTRRCRTKTTKMLDEPTIEELIKQIKVVHDGISAIVQYDGNLDIEIDEDDLDFDMEAIETLRFH
mmetsp:Transcript_58084/g.101663  ORF Transcript_58084/g.101663 Transcript_58084/m.101663 type:complete len:331 (+) Transcript_58084:40-1032(+)